jgi:chemotaxis protein MotB
MMMKRIAVALSAAALLSACVSQQTYQAEVKKSNSYQALSEQLQAELKSDQVQIQQLQNQVKVTLVDSLLFPEGGWQINRKGEETLDKIVPTLRNVKSGRIVVEGHTDNVPIGPALRQRFPSNWELSTARATDVVRYLASKGVPSNVLAAEGFGDSRPIAPNTTPEGRAKNRRVEIVISGIDQ